MRKSCVVRDAAATIELRPPTEETTSATPLSMMELAQMDRRNLTAEPEQRATKKANHCAVPLPSIDLSKGLTVEHEQLLMTTCDEHE